MFRSHLISCVMILGLIAPFAGISITAGANAKPRQQAQSAEASSYKMLTRQHRSPNEPVRIIDVQVKGQTIRLRDKAAKFTEGNDWLSGLVVRFKNVSDKPIASVEFHLAVAEPETSANLITFTLKYGSTPMPGIADPTELLMPGATAEVALSESWYDKARLSLERSQNSSIALADRADLGLSYVYFNDDTAWHP